jgi:hypothetical protein
MAPAAGLEDYVSNVSAAIEFRTLNHASSFPLELMLAMGAMLVGGVLKISQLRVGFLEATAAGCHGGSIASTISGKSMGVASPGCQPCRASISAPVLHRY